MLLSTLQFSSPTPPSLPPTSLFFSHLSLSLSLIGSPSSPNPLPSFLLLFSFSCAQANAYTWVQVGVLVCAWASKNHKVHLLPCFVCSFLFLYFCGVCCFCFWDSVLFWTNCLDKLVSSSEHSLPSSPHLQPRAATRSPSLGDGFLKSSPLSHLPSYFHGSDGNRANNAYRCWTLPGKFL